MEIISRAKVTIVLWSIRSVRSDFVIGEALKAHGRDSLVSTRLDMCDVPPPFNVRNIHDLMMWGEKWNDPVLEPIVSAVERKAGRGRIQVVSDGEVETHLRPKRRRSRILASDHDE